MLDFQSTLNESQSMQGPLGGVAFVILKALECAHAPREVVDTTRQQLYEYLPQLSDADCNVLANVIHERVQVRPTDGNWYSE